jgi:hypothetical protein
VADLYLFDFSGDADERARREEERARQRSLVRSRYAEQLTRCAGVDAVTADLVLATLFDHNSSDGSPCGCGCHPRLPEGTLHDAGFDCRCTWDDGKKEARQREWRAQLEEYWASPGAQELTRAREEECAEVAAWLEAHPGVTAEQTTACAPEQWQGTVDGRSFYFRERHGEWRIEIDLESTGHQAQRVIGTGPDGELLTEPVEMTAGTVIAEGLDTALGQTAPEHLEFIVGKIREHVIGETCSHHGAINFCPTCGCRV